MTVYVLVALIGLVLVAFGVGLWAVPAGFVIGGLELLGVAYVGAYLRQRVG